MSSKGLYDHTDEDEDENAWYLKIIFWKITVRDLIVILIVIIFMLLWWLLVARDSFTSDRHVRFCENCTLK